MEKEAIDFEGIPFELCGLVSWEQSPRCFIQLSNALGMYWRCDEPGQEFRRAVIKVNYGTIRITGKQVASVVFAYGKSKRIERHEGCSDEDWEAVKAWARKDKAKYQLEFEKRAKR